MMLAPFLLIAYRGKAAKMAATTASLATAGPSPSHASLSGLDGANFFIAGISAGFGPYVAAYLADQKWTQDNIGFVLTASGLAGLLSQVPGGELLISSARSERWSWRAPPWWQSVRPSLRLNRLFRSFSPPWCCKE